MSEALRQAARAALDELNGILLSLCLSDSYKAEIAATAKTLRAALAQPPAPTAQPAAYWIPKAEQFCIAKPGERPFAKAWEPLYAQPVQQPGVEPDGVLQTASLLEAMARNYAGGHSWDHLDGKACLRAAEMLRKLLPASPAQRQPLTQDEILDMADGVSLQFHDLLEFARAIEAAHGITAALAAQKGEKL